MPGEVTTPVLLQARKLHVVYPARSGFVQRRPPPLRALAGIDMDIDRGQIVGLVGPSGCGKTTLARCLSLLQHPTEGEIYLHGKRIKPLGSRIPRTLRRRIQYVFQDAQGAMNPWMRVGDSIAEGLVIHHLAQGKALKRRVIELLELVGLTSTMADRYPRQLSGGQRQRAAIARAIAVAPDLLVADEPVSALDVLTQMQIIELLTSLRKTLGMAVLLISHDLRLLSRTCPSLLVMEAGRIVERGATRDLFRAPQHPLTRSLLDALPAVIDCR